MPPQSMPLSTVLSSTPFVQCFTGTGVVVVVVVVEFVGAAVVVFVGAAAKLEKWRRW